MTIADDIKTATRRVLAENTSKVRCTLGLIDFPSTPAECAALFAALPADAEILWEWDARAEVEWLDASTPAEVAAHEEQKRRREAEAEERREFEAWKAERRTEP